MTLPPGMGEPSSRQNTGLPGVDIVQHGPGEILIVAAGPVTGASMRVAALLRERGFGVTVAKSRWVVPVRAELLNLVTRHRLAVTLEDSPAEGGGAGAALAQACAVAGISTPVRGIRLPRGFFEHREVLLTIAGLIGVDAALAGRTAAERSAAQRSAAQRSAAERSVAERNGAHP
ncbi:MAG TPA: transketolase C-terminal domain-containing protein [Streptosporangiaceae bacterium]